jgi:hypothetical protein
MTDPEWLSLADVAAALGVHPNTVRHWVRRGYLPSERHREPHEIGPPRYRMRPADVRVFAERHDTGAAPDVASACRTGPAVVRRAAPFDRAGRRRGRPADASPGGGADGLPIDTIRRWSAIGRVPVARRDLPALERQAWVRWSDVRAFGEVYFRDKPRPAWLDEAQRCARAGSRGRPAWARRARSAAERAPQCRRAPAGTRRRTG